jgi:hypothetical protein
MNRQVRGPSGIPERAILVTCLALAVGCGERGAGTEAVDSVRLHLDFGGGVTLTSVDYDLTGPSSFHQTGTLPVGSSDTIVGMFGNLPAGMGYDAKVQGTASDGSSTCTGEIVFNVPHPAVLQINLACSGLASVTATVNVCPVIDSVSVFPAEVQVGGSVQLVAAADDADDGPSPLAATWTVSSGMLNNASTAGATFTCTEVGPAQIGLSVSDGTPGPGCTDSTSVTVTCTQGGS